MELKKGDLLLFKGRGNWKNFLKFWDKDEIGNWCWSTNFIQFMIKLGTWSEYCHVGIVLDPNPNKLTIGEALDNGFTIYDAMGYVDRLIKEDMIHVYRVLDLTLKQRNEVVKTAYSIKGSSYDYKDILDIILHILTGFHFKFGKANQYICSEAVGFCYDKIFIYFTDKSIDEEVPKDIATSYITKKILMK